MTNYFIPESSELGQYILELSGIFGGMLNTPVSKKEILDNISYSIDSARKVRESVKDREYMAQFRGIDGGDDYYASVNKSFNDLVKDQRAKNLKKEDRYWMADVDCINKGADEVRRSLDILVAKMMASIVDGNGMFREEAESKFRHINEIIDECASCIR